MPAHLGYICALLYNQNNCAAEASTVTTSFELEVGTDLCVMMGYDRDKSMGHLVTGGSVANIEAIWAARNVKFFPLALQRALTKEKKLAEAKHYKVGIFPFYLINSKLRLTILQCIRVSKLAPSRCYNINRLMCQLDEVLGTFQCGNVA